MGSAIDTVFQVAPSRDSSTRPRGPINQHTSGAGDAPAVSVTSAPAGCVSHVEPPSVDRCTVPPASRQRLEGLGETIWTVAAAAARAIRRSALTSAAFVAPAAATADRAGAAIGGAGAGAAVGSDGAGAGAGAGGAAGAGKGIGWGGSGGVISGLSLKAVARDSATRSAGGCAGAASVFASDETACLLVWSFASARRKSICRARA